MTEAQRIVYGFNAESRLGRRVRYYPVAGKPEHKLSRIRSEAWLLGGHTPVVMIDGDTGCVALANCELLAPEVPA